MNLNLKTSRLNLRFVINEDLQTIHSLHSNPKIAEFNSLEIPKNTQETAKILNNWILENNLHIVKRYTFAIETIQDKNFIGLIGINLGKEKYRNAEVWFKLDNSFWNKGFATESLNKILDFGFETLHLHRIEAGCAIENFGSIKVLEKVGMQKEAHTRKLLPLNSCWSDNYGYAILSIDIRK
ncbi:MAG: ribosomal-protein-alanine N-acetyltransferase [Flavobacterium sp.]|jgi:ribosomal-protein-alanine N-acetyltransferase